MLLAVQYASIHMILQHMTPTAGAKVVLQQAPFEFASSVDGTLPFNVMDQHTENIFPVSRRQIFDAISELKMVSTAIGCKGLFKDKNLRTIKNHKQEKNLNKKNPLLGMPSPDTVEAASLNTF